MTDLSSAQEEWHSLGLCICGCLRRVSIAKQSRSQRGQVKGQPVLFINGHHSHHLDLGAYFWSQVDRNGSIIRPELGPCWPWCRSRSKDGYGQIMVNGRPRLATHIALKLDGRIVPKGLQALHSCDNPPCCNPAHLRIGTAVDNKSDAVERGRLAKGEHNGSAKLTAREVVEIRRAYAAGGVLGGKFGTVAPLIGENACTAAASISHAALPMQR